MNENIKRLALMYNLINNFLQTPKSLIEIVDMLNDNGFRMSKENTWYRLGILNRSGLFHVKMIGKSHAVKYQSFGDPNIEYKPILINSQQGLKFNINEEEFLKFIDKCEPTKADIHQYLNEVQKIKISLEQARHQISRFIKFNKIKFIGDNGTSGKYVITKNISQTKYGKNGIYKLDDRPKHLDKLPKQKYNSKHGVSSSMGDAYYG